MRNSKVGNLDSTYSICFSQVLLKLFTFLINTAIKRYTACSIVFNSGQTDKQTNKQTNKQLNKQTNKQTSKHTPTHK